jgi:hypothetical protein
MNSLVAPDPRLAANNHNPLSFLFVSPLAAQDKELGVPPVGILWSERSQLVKSKVARLEGVAFQLVHSHHRLGEKQLADNDVVTRPSCFVVATGG